MKKDDGWTNKMEAPSPFGKQKRYTKFLAQKHTFSSNILMRVFANFLWSVRFSWLKPTAIFITFNF